MLLFIGDEDRGYFVRESAKRLKKELKFIEYSPAIEKQINGILETTCDYMIFDIEQYLDKAEVVAEEIMRLQNAKSGTETIIYAPGYSAEAKIIQELKRKGIRYFILSAVPGDAKEQLERCLQGYYKEEVILKEPEEPETISEGKKIGITGACRRIGTTTQALQLVKYFQMKGYKACYIEMNSSGYVQNLEQYFNTVHDAYLGKVVFENVDMYYKQENISEILKQAYDYYIYDFGTYSDADFNKAMYQEKEVRIFVMGSKANEIAYTDEVLRNEYYKDVYYVFNFVSEQEQPDIIELMEERAAMAYFSGYIPDPFVFSASSQKVYEKMLPVKTVLPEPRKRGIFGRKIF